MKTMRLFRFGLPALLLISLCSVGLGHELGIVQVRAVFGGDGNYQITLLVDLEHLPPHDRTPGSLQSKFGPVTGLTPELRQEVGAFLVDYLNRSTVLFDSQEATPRLLAVDPNEAVETKAASIFAAPSLLLPLKLQGTVPPGVSEFRWINSRDLGAYVLSLQTGDDENVERQWLEGGKESDPFPLTKVVQPLTTAEIVGRYLVLGFTHILPKGLDHILFVLGIFLLSMHLRPMLIQVTAFTLAHTITLALAIYGLVSLRSSIVEPLIALSIVYVAVENVLTTELKPWRPLVVFCFGLLHGMGFAGVLTEIGLPRSQFLPALLSFNVGVEAGQMTVILGALLLVGVAFRKKPWYRTRIVIPGSILIATVGMYWAIQRIFFS